MQIEYTTNSIKTTFYFIVTVNHLWRLNSSNAKKLFHRMLLNTRFLTLTDKRSNNIYLTNPSIGNVHTSFHWNNIVIITCGSVHSNWVRFSVGILAVLLTPQRSMLVVAPCHNDATIVFHGRSGGRQLLFRNPSPFNIVKFFIVVIVTSGLILNKILIS